MKIQPVQKCFRVKLSACAKVSSCNFDSYLFLYIASSLFKVKTWV